MGGVRLRRGMAYLAATLILASAACGDSGSQQSDTAADERLDWDEVVQEAKGQTVEWYMWGGDDRINAYVDDWVSARAEEFGVTIERVPLTDTVEAVNKVLGEKQAGRNEGGSVDLIWINGENFLTGKQADLWHCGYTDTLPNSEYVDWEDPAVANDFGTPVEGCESPWARAQFGLIYNSDKVTNPPGSVDDLLDWIRDNPGRFTYPAPPDFTGSVFVRHIFYNAAGGYQDLLGPFDQETFDSVASNAWTILNDIESSLWREGSTYPESVDALNNLYSNGEVDMTMSYSPGSVPGLVEEGTFPDSTRMFVFDEGTIGNTSYVAIPYNSPDKAAAMVVANILLSPAAQYEMALPNVWGTYPGVDPTGLPDQWREKFEKLPTPPSVIPYEELSENSNPELQGKWLVEIEEGWKRNVLQD
jgi:putative spermidine/putrescine transport system substrate-binding protein